ncbi:MAG TPA: tetratricopeptide repeat protein [Tepidisphaeraceae bacterium]
MILYGHRRYAEAEVEFANALAEDPRNGMALAHLALCLANRRKYRRAAEVADLAIEASPASSFAHYVAAAVRYDAGELGRARQSIRRALALSPEDPSYLAVLAAIELRAGHSQAGLRCAEQGLSLDPVHTGCGIRRAEALIQLGRSHEAAKCLEAFLADNPEQPDTHAARGWALLAASRPSQAFSHFREALRLNPNCGYAREGYLEAIKSRSPLYRAAARSLRRAPRNPRGFGAMLIVGAFCALAAVYTGDHDGVKGTSTGFRLGCAAAAALLWFPLLALPLSNVFVRIHPILRYAMTPRQRILGDAALVLILAIGAGILTGAMTGQLWLATIVTDVALLGIPLARWLEVPSAAMPATIMRRRQAVLWGHFLAAILIAGIASNGSITALGCSGLSTILLALTCFVFAIDPRGSQETSN